MDRILALEKLREIYIEGSSEDLKRQYLMLQWFLNDEDKTRILGAIETKRVQEEAKIKRFASALGGTIIDK